MVQADCVKRVCFIVPRMSGGGAERVISLLANEMDSRGIKVSVAFTVQKTLSYELNPSIELIVNTKNSSPIGQILFLRLLMKKRRETIFVSFFTYQNIYALLAKVLLPNRVIVSERNDPRTTVYRHKYMGKLRECLYPKAYKIVFQTQDAMSHFAKRIQKKGCLILNPLNPELPDIYRGNRDNRIVAVSRINKQKNIPMMIDGLAPVLRKNPDFSLVIYGDALNRNGTTYEEVKEQIEKLGLSEKIVFMGFVDNVAQEIKNARLYVNTSDYEGISNSMLEAIALGIPSVCTDCPVGGARLFVQQGINGYLVPVGNVGDFTVAVEKTLANKEMLTHSVEAAEIIRENLNVSKIVDEWCVAIGL